MWYKKRLKRLKDLEDGLEVIKKHLSEEKDESVKKEIWEKMMKDIENEISKVKKKIGKENI